jgi:hypothetical protein
LKCQLALTNTPAIPFPFPSVNFAVKVTLESFLVGLGLSTEATKCGGKDKVGVVVAATEPRELVPATLNGVEVVVVIGAITAAAVGEGVVVIDPKLAMNLPSFKESTTAQLKIKTAPQLKPKTKTDVITNLSSAALKLDFLRNTSHVTNKTAKTKAATIRIRIKELKPLNSPEKLSPARKPKTATGVTTSPNNSLENAWSFLCWRLLLLVVFLLLLIILALLPMPSPTQASKTLLAGAK